MASRLPPGEAERRAKERARATWSGEKYRKVAPGSEAQWEAIAAAFIAGDVTFLEEARAFKGTASKKYHINPYLTALGLDGFPDDFAALRKAYRRAVMIAFREADFKDTAPAYVKAFATLSKAFEHVKLQKGW
ncbi:unnamed protein product [Sphagnum tenellum]